MSLPLKTLSEIFINLKLFKMNQFNFFLGCDTSKAKLNLALANAHGQIIWEGVVPNKPEHIATKLSTLLKTHHISEDKILLCVENTGTYNAWLLAAAIQMDIFTWVAHPLKVKKAMTQLRAKNDVLDARQIAQFAWRYRDQAQRYRPKKEHVQQIEKLLRLRHQLVQMRTMCKNKLAACENFDGHPFAVQTWQEAIDNFNDQIKQVEKQIRQIIKLHKELKTRVQLLTSIPGVGLFTACAFIVFTNDFEDFTDPRKFACHAGVVPFGASSGTIEKRPTTSSQAQKFIKAYLSNAAMAAIRSHSRLRAYYQRKIDEGKPQAVVLNNLRNKIVHIAFAIIRTGKAYDDNYSCELKAA